MHNGGKKRIRSFSWFLIWGIIVVLLIVFVICLAKHIEQVSVSDNFSPPGKLYDIGGYKLHLWCRGSGSPTVVMESGSGDFSLTWALVAPEIAKKTRVCVYDRAGLGFSDPSPLPRLATTEVSELHTLLEKAGIDAPYILVGHSYGGVLARLFTHTYPDDVKGLVLVDPGHEEQKTLQTSAVQESMNEATSQSLKKISDYTQKSFDRLLTDTETNPLISVNLPAQERMWYSYIMQTKPVFWQTVYDETKNMDTSFEEIKNQNITSLGNIPLIVISSGQSLSLAMTSELSEKADKVLRDLQDEIVHESPQGKHITAQKSSHLIQLICPKVVINAIQQVFSN